MNEARALAERALAEVGVRPDRLRAVAASFNTVVRADAGERSYAVRVGPRTRIHPDGSEETEAGWLEAIRRDGAADAPLIVRGEDGVAARHVGLAPSDRRSVTVLEWLDGRRSREPLALRVAHRMGRAMALLHEHASSHRPAGPVPVADRTLYWDVPTRLDELAVSHGSLFAEALHVADAAIARLWAAADEPPRLLHGDFRPANLLVGAGGSLRIIDFQDLVLGLPVQDIAITASALLARPHGRGLLDAFGDGYSTARAWPAIERPVLDALIVGRRLHQLNLGLTLRDPGLDSMVDRFAAEIRAFFAAGRPGAGRRSARRRVAAPDTTTAVAARSTLTPPDRGGGMNEDAGIGEMTAPEAVAEARRAVRALFLDDRHVHGCAESAFVALKRAFALPDPDDASAAMALNGGIAYSGATCGAITGAALALGMLAARRVEDHGEAKRVARLLTAELLRRFEDEFGSSLCRELTGADLTTEEGHQAFIDGGSWRDGCLRQLESAVSGLAPLVREDAWASALARIEVATGQWQDDERPNADGAATGQQSERTDP